MGKSKAIIAATAATVVVAGGLIYTTVDRWFSDEPSGPGSGEELKPGETPTGDNLDRGNGPGEFGPGSGEELPADEPTGPGSGEELKPGETPTGDNLDRGNGPGEFGPGSGEELPADEPTGPGSGDELDVKGSCNTIDDGSTCIEYIGSYFDRLQNMQLNCAGVGIFSTQGCPRPAVGGCNTSSGTANEMIAWFYDYGGDPFTPDVVPYAAMACNANPFGAWIE